MLQLKQPGRSSEESDRRVRESVETMLEDIDKRSEFAIRELAKKFDDWEGDFVLSDEKKQGLIDSVPQQVKDDLRFAYEQVYRFAEAQRDSMQSFEVETHPGVLLGQRVIPVQCAGCYVPGGRYAHAASAIMSVATAKAAGVPFVVAASPPRGNAIDAAVCYAMDLAGADMILEMGGVQAVAAMANGIFTDHPADIIVGPGNAYVAEAKRILFGQVGIDVFAGPTESAIIADDSADAMTIAVDLCSQAEHGVNSPVWLFTTSQSLAEKVLKLIPMVAADMPNADVVNQAWNDYGEIIACDNREEVVKISDQYACEHLQVMAADLEWWKQNLNNYGSHATAAA